LAARFVRDEEAAGSNPATPTRSEAMRSLLDCIAGLTARVCLFTGLPFQFADLQLQPLARGGHVRNGPAHTRKCHEVLLIRGTQARLCDPEPELAQHPARCAGRRTAVPGAGHMRNQSGRLLLDIWSHPELVLHAASRVTRSTSTIACWARVLKLQPSHAARMPGPGRPRVQSRPPSRPSSLASAERGRSGTVHATLRACR
jgi:hypothetical protein